MPPANPRPVATPRSRKSLLKQPGSFVGRAQPQPQSIPGTPLPVEPLLFGNQSNPQFSFNSEETSLPAAPVVFGNQPNTPSALNPGTLPAEDFPLPATPEPLVFGNQSNTPFAFHIDTLPTPEESSLPPAPLVVSNHSNAQPELTSDTESEEESLEKMVADMDAALAESPTASVSNYIPRDPNYGLDMSFGLDTDLPPAIPNIAQGPNLTQYPDPTLSDSGYSLLPFSQGSTIPASDLAHPSSSQDPKSTVDLIFTPGLSIARDLITQDPCLDPELNLPLDPSLSLANEHGNYQPFPASTTCKAPSATQHPDPKIPDNARSFQYFFQDPNIPDLVLPRINFSQDSKCTVDPSFVPNLNVAQDLSFQQQSGFPLDPNLSLANQIEDSKPFTASIVPPASSMTQYTDPNAQDPACSLPYFGQDSSMQDSESPRPNFSRDLKSAVDPSFFKNLDVAQDSNFQHPSFAFDPNLESFNLGPIAEFNASYASGFAQDPELPLPNFSLDPQSTVNSSFVPNLNVAQNPVAEDSSFQQDSRFPLDPSLGFSNEHGNFKPTAAFNAPQALSVAQDPTLSDLASAARHPESSSPNFSQVLQSAADLSFVPNLNFAQNPVAESSFQQDSRFPLDPSLGLANEHRNFNPIAGFNAPQVLNVAHDSNVQDLASAAQHPESSLPNFSQDLQSAVDLSLVPNLKVAQNPVAEDSSFQEESGIPLNPNLGLGNEHGNFKPVAASTAPSAPNVVLVAKVSDPACFTSNFVQDSTARAPKLPLPKSSQDPKSVTNPTSSFVPNFNFAQNPSAQDSSFPVDPNFGLANGRGNFQPDTASAETAQSLIHPHSTNFEPQAQHQDLQSNSGFHMNVSDQGRAFDINHSGFKQSQLVRAPRFPQTPLSASVQNVDGNEDSRFDLMDTEPDYKITPPSWKQNQLTQNMFDTHGRGGLPEHSTDPNSVSTSRHISSSVTFVGPAHQEVLPKGNIKDKQSTIAASTNPLSNLPSPAASTNQAAASHPDPIRATRQVQSETADHHEIKKLRAEIERKTKEISDKDERIRRCNQEKLTLEKANHSLVRENRETKELQGKAKKNTDLIKKLSGEVGRLHRKQSRLEQAKESLAKEASEDKANLDTLCRSNLDLKEENRALRASIDDLHPLKSEIDEAKKTIGAQKAEIQDKSQRIAALNPYIDEISQELRWRTEDLQEAERFLLREESISKYYRDRYYILWNKNQALESAGDSRDTELAKLELQKEQEHSKELGALNLQIADLQVENKRLTPGDVEGGLNTKEADKVGEKVQDIPGQKDDPDGNQKLPESDEEPPADALRSRQEKLKARRKEKAKELEGGYKLGLAHEVKPERVAAAPSILIEEPAPQDGTPVSPHPSAPVVPGTGEATGEEATTAAPTRSLIHNIWSMILWFKGLSDKWEWFFFTLFITVVLVVGTVGAYLSYLDAVTTILDEAVYMVPQMVERGLPAVEVRRYMLRGLGAAGVPGL